MKMGCPIPSSYIQCKIFCRHLKVLICVVKCFKVIHVMVFINMVSDTCAILYG